MHRPSDINRVERRREVKDTGAERRQSVRRTLSSMHGIGEQQCVDIENFVEEGSTRNGEPGMAKTLALHAR